MKYLAVVCGLLFAGSVWAENAYFEGYVTMKSLGEEEESKATYVLRGDVFELTLFPPDGEDGEPMTIAAMMKETDNEKIVSIYSADGEQRIGTGTAKGDDAFTLEFPLLFDGMKGGDITLDKQLDDDGDMPGLTLSLKIVGIIDVTVEGNLSFDLTKYMRCSQDSEASDC